jgi:hypothetical protein
LFKLAFIGSLEMRKLPGMGRLVAILAKSIQRKAAKAQSAQRGEQCPTDMKTNKAMRSLGTRTLLPFLCGLSDIAPLR